MPNPENTTLKSALSESAGLCSPPETGAKERHRLLVVDDNWAIHDDIRKILQNEKLTLELEVAESRLFGLETGGVVSSSFQIDSAYQGQEALALVEKSLVEGNPYSMAFVDVRMPPGWDGVETISRLWQVDPRIQIVLCTAYSDYLWKEIIRQLRCPDRLLILKKPFDSIEVHQLVASLTEKWALARHLEAQMGNLEALVQQRTSEAVNSLALIRATLEATADGILVINQNGAVVMHNRRFLEMWQVPPTLAAGDGVSIWPHLLSQIGADAFAAKWQDFRYVTPAHEFDLVKFPDGRVFEACSRPQTIGQTVVGTVWSFRDITRRVALEEQFRQAQKMESVGQLAGGVAHDFNNILTIIQGYTALLRGSVAPPDQEAVREIETAAQRAINLTRQLLTFSRRQIIQRADLNLREVIPAISQMLRRLIGETIELKTEFSSANPVIHADLGMLEQILTNLAVNAREAMPQGGNLTIRVGEIDIAAPPKTQHPEIKAGTFVCVEVADTGGGIAPEHMEHLFEPFFTTKDVGRGPGLGLATVYGIVKQHKGWITAHSQVGQGTTFKIYFPAVQAVSVTSAKPSSSAKTSSGQETILLVDDENVLRGLAARILKAHGYQVLEAASAVKALEVRRQFSGKIDLLLTDMVMPEGMSGQELARLMQAETPQVKVIFTSGYSVDIFGKDISLQPGFNFLQKPYLPDDLIQAIQHCLRQT